MEKISTDKILQIIDLYKAGYTHTEISVKLDISQQTSIKYVKLNNIPPRNTGDYYIHFDRFFFEKIDTEDKAYWLGFLFADGTITDGGISLCLAEIDKGHLIKFNRSINNTKENLYFYQTKASKSKTYKLYLCSKNLVKDCLKYNLVPRKSLIANPDLSSISIDLHRHFWRGVFDGDGCLFRYKNQYKTGYLNSWRIDLCGSENTLIQFRNFIQMPERNIYKHNGIWNIAIGSKENVKPILDLLYHNSNIYLDRKYEKYLTFKELNQ